MPAHRLLVFRRAQDDLLRIWSYVAQHNPSAADKLLRRLAETGETLSRHPHLGDARPEFHNGMRKWTVGNWIVLYRVVDDGIEVARYVDARRDLGDLSR